MIIKATWHSPSLPAWVLPAGFCLWHYTILIAIHGGKALHRYITMSRINLYIHSKKLRGGGVAETRENGNHSGKRPISTSGLHTSTRGKYTQTQGCTNITKSPPAHTQNFLKDFRSHQISCFIGIKRLGNIKTKEGKKGSQKTNNYFK